MGGIAGTLIRYWLSLVIPSDRTGALVANLIGVSIAAFLLVFMERRGITEIRLLLLPGFCAGLTTFSAVTVHTLEPRAGGFLYLLVNVFLSLLIVAIVLPVSRKYIPVRK
ncbi:MAG: CrcB family protein [Actinobacteria bacterium]|nr:CrcB family protein [Actinomycetota bacterium]